MQLDGCTCTAVSKHGRGMFSLGLRKINYAVAICPAAGKGLKKTK